MKQNLSITLGALLLASTAAGTAMADTTLSMIVCGDDGTPGVPVQAAQIAEWEANNPGYKVAVEFVPWGQCQEKSTTLAAAGNPPALSYMGSRTLKQLALNDLILPMNLTDAEKATYAAPVLGTITWNGQQWGLPRAFSTKALYWNKDVFEAAGLDPETPPTTWAEMLEDAKTITENTDSAGVGLAAASFDNTMHQFLNWIYSNGGAVVDDDGNIVFNSPQNVETMQFIADLVPYAEPGPVAYDRAKLRPLFAEGQIGMMVSGPWERVQLPEGVNWGVARIPHGPSGESGTLLITDSLAVFKGSGVEEQALSLAKWLTSPEHQMPFDLAEGWTPIRTGPETDALIEQNPTWAPFLQAIPDGGPEPFVTDYVALQDIINEAIQSVVLGEVDPAEAVEVAADELQSVQ
ncbi:sugar ABC transporter substrate-binding protein [Tropicimonas sp. IMCC34043]|uniref:ABC transporter substrate-binding protein n=1 Tax=Tropicimonas sp. IMCC34043 TaxID=2248760 RepID=UPI001E333000|nr:sugar ABC transporter substrate-binding protein [Tropicimonas sp. IMCC34043]